MSDSMICLSLMKTVEVEGISHLFRRRLKSESTVSIALVPKLAIAHSVDVLGYSAANCCGLSLPKSDFWFWLV